MSLQNAKLTLSQGFSRMTASAIFSAQTAPHTLMAKWRILQTLVIGTVVVFIHYFTLVCFLSPFCQHFQKIHSHVRALHSQAHDWSSVRRSSAAFWQKKERTANNLHRPLLSSLVQPPDMCHVLNPDTPDFLSKERRVPMDLREHHYCT